MIFTLTTDSAQRKDIPIRSGALDYFPAAIAGVATHSVMGNNKHNPGEELHHARGKSMDHGDCIERHLTDIGDIKAAIRRGEVQVDDVRAMLLAEANALSWRSLALAQDIHEEFGGAPLAPAARRPGKPTTLTQITAAGADEQLNEPFTATMLRAHNAATGNALDRELSPLLGFVDPKPPKCPICNFRESVTPSAEIPGAWKCSTGHVVFHFNADGKPV